MATILLVEDVEIVRTTLATALEKADHIVTAVTNPGSAWEEFQRHFFDLVITDVDMESSLNGIDLCVQIKGISPNTPVIVMSSDRLTYAQASLAAGANEFLEKPFSPLILIATVTKLLP